VVKKRMYFCDLLKKDSDEKKSGSLFGERKKNDYKGGKLMIWSN